MKVVMYPGTFDPFTNGHYDIVQRALLLFDNVVIAIGENVNKHSMFSVSDRINMIKNVFVKEKRVKIISFSGLLVDVLQQHNITIQIRGLRNLRDFDYEQQLYMMNKSLSVEIETVFLSAQENHMKLSSSIIRELIIHQSDIAPFVPQAVLSYIHELSSKTLE